MVVGVPETDLERTTALLLQLAEGDGQAQDRFYAAICDELRTVASGLMRQQAAGHTLQPTALVHEAWIRLVSGRGADLREPPALPRRRRQGDAFGARRPRASASARHKRGGDMCASTSSTRRWLASRRAATPTCSTLDAALSGAAARDDPELARLVELRFFGGLTQ